MIRKNFHFTKSVIVLISIVLILFFVVPASASIWVSYNSQYMLLDEDGSPVTGWQYIDNDWYFFDESGYMQTGWLYDGYHWYLLGYDGIMITGWAYYDENWYFLDYSGRMLTGIQLISNNTYYFNEYGQLCTGWVWYSGYWYRFDEESAIMLTDWQLIDGYWYYFIPENGHMAYDCWVTGYDGKACYINNYGVWITGGLTWFGDSISTLVDGRNAIYTLFYEPDIYSQEQRCILEDKDDNPSGLTVASQVAEADDVQDYIVFQMGSNLDESYPDVSTTEKINQLISIVGNDKKIVLVTAYNTNDWCTEYYYGQINSEIREMAASNPNIAVADWAAVCNPETDLIDYAHPNEYGSYKYMSLIRDTLVTSFGPEQEKAKD